MQPTIIIRIVIMYNLVKLCHKLFYYDYARKHHEVQDVQVVDLVGGGVVRVL